MFDVLLDGVSLNHANYVFFAVMIVMAILVFGSIAKDCIFGANPR